MKFELRRASKNTTDLYNLTTTCYGKKFKRTGLRSQGLFAIISSMINVDIDDRRQILLERVQKMRTKKK